MSHFLKATTLILPLLAASIAAPTAFAHAYPKTESPAKGSTVRSAPTLWIEFDDELEPHFTGVIVKDAMGMSVDEGAPYFSSTDPRLMTVKLKPMLPPGQYTVIWHATDTDTHKTHGSYGFTVEP